MISPTGPMSTPITADTAPLIAPKAVITPPIPITTIPSVDSIAPNATPKAPITPTAVSMLGLRAFILFNNPSNHCIALFIAGSNLLPKVIPMSARVFFIISI